MTQRHIVEMQQEVFRMVCQYYDHNPKERNDDAISHYMGLVWTSNAKDTRKAHKYWTNLLEKENAI